MEGSTHRSQLNTDPDSVARRALAALGLEGAAATRLLAVYPGLQGLGGASVRELARAAELDHVTAHRIRAAFAVVRAADIVEGERSAVDGAADAIAVLQQVLGDHPRECFAVVLLDQSDRVIDTVIVAEGTSDTVVADPREVFRAAVRMGACSVVVAHSHPHGDPTPSAEDDEVTELLVATGDVLGIPVRDHVVLARHGVWSYADAGDLCRWPEDRGRGDVVQPFAHRAA